MTLPAPDYYLYEGEIHRIHSTSNPEGIFSPSHVGIETQYHSTANWRGYVAIYTQMDEKLFLHSLCVETTTSKAINTIKPLPHPYGIFLDRKLRFYTLNFPYYYSELALPLPYTGKILIQTLHHSMLGDGLLGPINHLRKFITEHLNKPSSKVFGLSWIQRKFLLKDEIHELIDNLRKYGYSREAKQIKRVKGNLKAILSQLENLEEVWSNVLQMDLKEGQILSYHKLSVKELRLYIDNEYIIVKSKMSLADADQARAILGRKVTYK